MHSTTIPSSRPGSSRSAAGDSDVEPTAAATEASSAVGDTNLASEHAGDALNDREAEADAAGDPSALVEAMEFFEHRAMFGRRNADPGIINIDAEPLALTPAADQHAAVRCVFDGIGNEVLQESPQ